jgi:hypothetical protein
MRNVFGHFERRTIISNDWFPAGEYVINTDWCRDCRDMIVRKDARFVGPDGRSWEVYDGDRTNGHSIPWFMKWIFQPYEGVTREAAVFHDVHCQLIAEDSKVVHKMFYDAMRANGARWSRAYVMWLGVRVFGPRFKGK